MRVSDTHRVLFVHVPKTGGSTLDHIFDNEIEGSRWVLGRSRHSTYKRLLVAEPGLADYWTCGFVRNPWARMVSWWSMGNDMHARAEAGRARPARVVAERPDIWEPFGRYRDDFHRFVMEGTVDVPRFGKPQLKWLTAKGGAQIDFIGRVESFVADVNVVRERLGLEPVPEQPRKNRSAHGHYSDYYDDETRDRVAEVFAPDIKAFDYTF